MDQVVGEYFEFCFESKNFLNQYGDPVEEGSFGDNTFLDNVHFSNEEVVSIDELESKTLSVYPNPSNGLFYLESVNPLNGSVEVIDLQGRRVYKQKLNLGANAKLELDLSTLSDGIYTINVISNEGMINTKVFIY